MKAITKIAEITTLLGKLIFPLVFLVELNFIILKLTDLLSWSWGEILIPLWIGLIFGLSQFIEYVRIERKRSNYVIITGVGAIPKEEWRKMKENRS